MLVSIDRLTIDVALAALCIGFVLFSETDRSWPLYGAVLGATLVRETGFLLLAGCVGALILERRFVRAAVYATAAAPAAVWYWYVSLHTTSVHVAWFSALPFAGYVWRVLHPFPYPFAWPVAWAATVLDYTALSGFALAFGLGLRLLFRKNRSPNAIAVYGFMALMAMLGSPDVWAEVYGFGRTLTPLLLLLALASMVNRRLVWAMPLLLVTPRIALQYAPLAYHVATGIFQHPR